MISKGRYLSIFARFIRALQIQNGSRRGIGSGESMVNIDKLNEPSWYLAQYITGGKNRERLFDWLSEQQITPWTPLIIRTIRRSDKINGSRKKISALFPGYFFLKADFATHPVDKIRRHSAFSGFVMTGVQIAPVRPAIVEGLMQLHPDPSLCPQAADELKSANQASLTSQQYHYLLRMDDTAHPLSRLALLMKLITEPAVEGF